MKKKYFLKSKEDFKKVIDSKNYFINEWLILYCSKWPDFKIGISIPSKFLGSVGRNYNKRQIKHIFWKNRIVEKSQAFVLITRKPFLELSFLEKEKKVLKTLKKAKENFFESKKEN